MNATQRTAWTLGSAYGRTLSEQERLRQAISALMAAARATIRLWRRRIRERDELSRMSAIERQDLSLSPNDVGRETRKWFWQP